MVANRSATVRGTSAFAALVAFEVAAVVLLHRLGELPWLQVPYRHLGPWLEGGAPEDVIAAVARVVALVIAWWLLATTALYVLARVSRVPAAVRAVEWVTLPAVRRVADQALALTLATSLVGGGANAALAGTAVAGRLAGTPVAGAGYQPHPAGPPETTTPGTAAPPPGYVPHPAGTVPPGPPPPGPGPSGPRAAPPARPDVHRVRGGDNLWTIARDHLAEVTGRDAGALAEHDVAAYWLEVVATNRATLRSGDPDLIYPGELVRLPPVPGRDG